MGGDIVKKEIYQDLVNNFFHLNKDAKDAYTRTKFHLDHKSFSDSNLHPTPRKFTQNRSPKV